MLINLTVNNNAVEWDIQPGQMLLDVLRQKGFLSVKAGCNTGSCGLCTVWLDEKPVLACALLAAKTNGRAVTTIEGVQQEARELAIFLASQGVEQCGYCSPGFVMTILAMKRELANPNEEEIKHYLSGNLCRCSGYVGQLRAIVKYLSRER